MSDVDFKQIFLLCIASFFSNDDVNWVHVTS